MAKHMGIVNILEYLMNLSPARLSDQHISKNFGQYFVPNYRFQISSGKFLEKNINFSGRA